MVAERSVAVAVVAFSPRFAFLSMMACCETQREAADLKIAGCAWWVPKTQWMRHENSGWTRGSWGQKCRRRYADADTQMQK